MHRVLVKPRIGVVPVAALLLAACGSGDGIASRMSPAAKRGESVFTAHCSTCHSNAGSAPDLTGLIGRKAGSTAFPYSKAMRGSGVTWTRESLEAFLAAPRKLIPDNQMAFFGMPDPAMRADMVEFLASRS